METKLVVFKNKKIRRTLHNNAWWFSVADVVEALTDSADTKQYIKKIRRRDSELNGNWGTICTPLKILAQDGKIRATNCANTEGIFRIIFSMLGKAATTEITRKQDAKGFNENKTAAQKGGRISGEARENNDNDHFVELHEMIELGINHGRHGKHGNDEMRSRF